MFNLNAPVAQLDRASAFEAEGRGFESLRARHSSFFVFWNITSKAFCKYDRCLQASMLLPDLVLAAFIRQQRFLEVKSSFKQNPTLETPDLRCELILVPFETGKLTHGLTPTGVMVPLFMLFADHSDTLREMSPVRRSKPTKRPVRISTTRWFSKKNPTIGTRVLFVPVVLSLVFGLATSTIGTSASAQSAVLSDRKHDTHGQQIRPGESVHADVDLALVNVSVTDAHDRPITSLERDSFRILEDNIEQEVVNFSSEDVPVSIGCSVTRKVTRRSFSS